MKKQLLSLATALLVAAAANAQIIVGGALSFGANGGQVERNSQQGVTKKSPVSFGMTIAPKVGYILDEKYEFGVSLDVNYNHTMYYNALLNSDGEKGRAFRAKKEFETEWSINPYGRVRCFETKGFGIWVEGIVRLGGLGTYGEKAYTYDYDGIYGYGDQLYYTQNTRDEAKRLTEEAEKKYDENHRESHFRGGLYIQPILTYDINEHWILETRLNFLGFNLSGGVDKYSVKNGDNWEWEKNNTCQFSLNVTGEDVARIGYLTIGAVYKF